MTLKTFSKSLLLALLIYGCSQVPPPVTMTPLPSPSAFPPTPSSPPSATPVPSATLVPPTPTPSPQPLLLRRPCGKDFAVRANSPLQIFYGGWGVKGKDLADQWATALVVDLTIDGESILGTVQPPAPDLPYNCRPAQEGTYWVYSMITIPGLSTGRHHVREVFSSLRPLSDGTLSYGTGKLFENTFTIIAQ